jgi:predicted GIY-YIG superfamily endonuclease
MKQPAVYLLANRRNGTLYVGVTSNLLQRIHQHREATIEGFASRYGCRRLVWYEIYDDMSEAIAREKQIKGGSRDRKVRLIEQGNPEWRDLWPDIA